jgi:alpha-beta hydrolase superfamily lysophospholipase
MPDPDLPSMLVPKKRPYRRQLWIFLFALFAIAAIIVNGAAFLAAHAMTHYVADADRPHIHVPMTAWDKARLFLGALALPRPVNTFTPADKHLDYETLHFPGAHGLQLEAWRVRGEEGKPVVLLFPGYEASKTMLIANAHEFHNLGYECWMVDFHGAGGSQGSTTTIGWSEADDVAAASRQAAQLRPRAPQILFGVSLGAAAILRAEHLHTVEPAALILECPYDRLTTAVSHRFSALGIPPFPMADLLVFWGGAQLGFNPRAMNPVDFARDVRCPTLLMDGDHDYRVGLMNERAIATALGSHGTFEVFPDAGHAFYLQRQPDRWRQTVRSFLALHLPLAAGSATSSR